MNKSDSIAELAKALAKFNERGITVEKNGINPHFGNKYAKLDDIIAATKIPLAEVGLSVVQLPSGTACLTTMLIHDSGEFIEVEASTSPSKNDPQGLGSGITYFRRYSMAGLLGLESEPDDDGNAASGDAKGAATVQTARPAGNAPNCSKCGAAMALKPAGVSKAGKPYGAFWSCKAKRPDGTWCNNTMSIDVQNETATIFAPKTKEDDELGPLSEPPF